MQTNFTCIATQYAPDGTTLVLLSPGINNRDNYLICNLETPHDTIIARQICATNKTNYISIAFHPSLSIVALLSKSRYIHLFDYKTLNLLAQTKKLQDYPCTVFHSKQLDFDEEGKHLAAALASTWKSIEVPQNNFYAIWRVLYINSSESSESPKLPKEVIGTILNLIKNLYSPKYSFIDFDRLDKVIMIKKAISEEKKVNQTVTKKNN